MTKFGPFCRPIQITLLVVLMLFGGITPVHAGEEDKQVRSAVNLSDGSNFDIASQHGKFVLIAIWATWCPICLGELPELEKIYRKYKNAELEIIALGSDPDPQKFNEYVASRRFSFPIARRLGDGKTDNLEAPPVTPVFYPVDQNGRDKWRKIGPVAQLFPH